MPCGHVVLAESHPAMLEGIRRLIETMAESVIMVADEPSLIQAIHKTKPDLVIADFSFQVFGATNVVRLVKQKQPAIKVIVVSIHEDATALHEAVVAGAEGFVLKRRAVVDLIPAIQAVCGGCRYIPMVNCGDKDRGGK